MAKLNFLLSLNSYLDTTSTNNPNLNIVKWTRDFQGLVVDKPQSAQLSLAPGETKTLFDGTRSLLHDVTTAYEISLKSGTSSTYVLKNVGGTAPAFRIVRNSGADATTEVTVTKNGSVLTFASTAGTPFNLIANGVTVGDKVTIGSTFIASNQGVFTIIARTATSFSVENVTGDAEGPISLGAGYLDEIRIYSASGVQIGDTVKILGSFSPATLGSYEITAVQDNLIEFYSTSSLPSETVVTDQFSIYSNAKKMIYIESNGKLSIQINSASQGEIEPFVAGSEVKPATFLKTETVWSLSLTNSGLETASVYLASVE